MSTENSKDIFFLIKKEILDKLDTVLQRVNLEILNSSTRRQALTNQSDFIFIELSQFEQQISPLFLYLDKLYESLESSISSIYQSDTANLQEISQSKIQELEHINSALSQENAVLRDKINSINSSQKIVEQEMLRNMGRVCKQLQQLKCEFKELQKSVKSQCKESKFIILQDRIKYIAKLKQYEVGVCNSIQKQRPEASRIRNGRQLHGSEISSIGREQHKNQACASCDFIVEDSRILEELNEILALCHN